MVYDKEKLFRRLDTSEMKELHEPSVAYARNTELPTFFGQPMLKGTFTTSIPDQRC